MSFENQTILITGGLGGMAGRWRAISSPGARG